MHRQILGNRRRQLSVVLVRILEHPLGLLHVAAAAVVAELRRSSEESLWLVDKKEQTKHTQTRNLAALLLCREADASRTALLTFPSLIHTPLSLPCQLRAANDAPAFQAVVGS